MKIAPFSKSEFVKAFISNLGAVHGEREIFKRSQESLEWLETCNGCFLRGNATMRANDATMFGKDTIMCA